MSIDIAATRARVIALPGSTGVDIALGLLDEIERLRAEVSRRDRLGDSGAYAAAEDAERQERAAVVAWLHIKRMDTCDAVDGDNAVSATYAVAAARIERGEHRREEEP